MYRILFVAISRSHALTAGRALIIRDITTCLNIGNTASDTRRYGRRIEVVSPAMLSTLLVLLFAGKCARGDAACSRISKRGGSFGACRFHNKICSLGVRNDGVGTIYRSRFDRIARV